jgi:thiopurine S-methyltransferase
MVGTRESVSQSFPRGCGTKITPLFVILTICMVLQLAFFFFFQWEAKRIGFHLPEMNPVLQKYAPQLFQSTSSTTSSSSSSSSDDPEDCSATRVFVPLCGKTVDMAYLTSMAEVVGVEGIKTALEEFQLEQPDLQIELQPGIQNGFERFVGTKITLLKGDFFELTTEDTNGSFDVIYDRASMVAIQPELRSSYVDVLGRLLSKGGKILLVVLDRRGTEEAIKKGPPFSIPEATVLEFYEGLDWVESVTLLEQQDTLTEDKKEQGPFQGLDQLLETVYIIEAKK